MEICITRGPGLLKVGNHIYPEQLTDEIKNNNIADSDHTITRVASTANRDPHFQQKVDAEKEEEMSLAADGGALGFVVVVVLFYVFKRPEGRIGRPILCLGRPRYIEKL